MWSQQRTAVGSRRALYGSFEMDANTSGRKERPLFRALPKMGYSFVGNQKTFDSKDNLAGKLSSTPTIKPLVNRNAYDILTTRKSPTMANGYEIKTKKQHTPTNSYYDNTGSKPFTPTHLHTETTRFMTTRKPHTSNAYEIGTTRNPQTHTFIYKKTTVKPFTTTHRHTDTTRLITTRTTKHDYKIETTRKPLPSSHGYEKTTEKPHITTQTDTSFFSQPHPPTYTYEKTVSKPQTTTLSHTDTSRSSDGYKITSNHVTKVHHIGTKLYSQTDHSKIVSITKPYTTANAYEVGTTRKRHPPTYGYEKTTRKPRTTTQSLTSRTRLTTTRKSHTITNEIRTTSKQNSPTYGYESTTTKPYTINYYETSTLSQPHTPTYAYENTATSKPHMTTHRHTENSRSSNGDMGINEYDWWLYDTTAYTGSVKDKFFKSYSTRDDANTGYYSKAPITWYDESSKSNTEYQVQGSLPTIRRIVGHNSRKPIEYDITRSTKKRNTSKSTKHENGTQGYWGEGARIL